MNVSTVIVTYNALRNNWLYKCLDSILHSTLPSEIIIVDNHSQDDTCKVIKEKYPKILLVENRKNAGFGKANNMGIEIALKNSADFVLLLNQDAWIEPTTIENLVSKMIENPNYGILSPLHLNGKGNALDYNFSTYITPDLCKNLYSDFVLNQVKDQIYESDFICAAAWLISKKCLEVVGGFSPTFFHYGEDVNYVQRLQYKGLKIGVAPNTRIYHDREDREDGVNQDQDKTIERGILLKYSNPDEKNEVLEAKKHLRKLLFKSKILNQKDSISYLKKRIVIINQNHQLITENLLLSKTDLSYVFLNLNL